jgi:tetratricopeptide (TPR) repeat protein
MTEIIRLTLAALFYLAQHATYYEGIAASYAGDTDRAIRLLTDAISRNPKDSAPYAGRGRVYLNKGSLDRALADYTSALRLDPRDPGLHFMRGTVSLARGDYNGAIADLTEGLRLRPKDAYALTNRAAAYLAKDEWDKAIADATEALRLDPANAGAYVNRAGAYVPRGDFEAAIADSDRALRLDPGIARAYQNRGAAYLAKGDYDKAIADFDQGLRLEPSNVRLFVNRGVAHTARAEEVQAVADFDQALRLDPNDPTAQLRLAWLLATCLRPGVRDERRAVGLAKAACDRTGWKDPTSLDVLAAASAGAGDFAEAVKWGKKCIEIALEMGLEEKVAPVRERLALYQRGKSYRELDARAYRDPDRVVAVLSDAIRHNPKDVDAYVVRAVAYETKGCYDLAIADLDQALHLTPIGPQTAPDRATVYYSRGDAWVYRGDCDKALADFSDVIRLDPKHVGAFIKRGSVWYAKKEDAKALADYGEAARLDPNNATALACLAWVRATCPHEKYRDGKAAVEFARRACELNGWKDPTSLDTLAAACAEIGDYKGAVQYQRQALDSSNYPNAIRDKGRLRLKLYEAGKPYRDE